MRSRHQSLLPPSRTGSPQRPYRRLLSRLPAGTHSIRAPSPSLLGPETPRSSAGRQYVSPPCACSAAETAEDASGDRGRYLRSSGTPVTEWPALPTPAAARLSDVASTRLHTPPPPHSGPVHGAAQWANSPFQRDTVPEMAVTAVVVAHVGILQLNNVSHYSYL